MPLVQRIRSRPHTIAEFRRAARLRYQEALRLAVAGDRLAAIYLSGYAAEMLLKAAFFRLAGKKPGGPLSVQDMYNAREHATRRLGIAWHGGNLHDLPSWAALLIEERKWRGSTYPRGFDRALHSRVKTIYLNWREDLRYRANRPYEGEVSQTLRNVHWLLGQFRFL